MSKECILLFDIFLIDKLFLRKEQVLNIELLLNLLAALNLAIYRIIIMKISFFKIFFFLKVKK